MEKYCQFAEIHMDFCCGYLDALLYIVISVLNNWRSHRNNVKSTFFPKTGKSNVSVKWRIMDIQPNEAPAQTHYLGTKLARFEVDLLYT